MEEQRQYWPTTDAYNPSGVEMEMRAGLAWELIRGYGLVGGKVRETEDSAGRAVLDLQDPEEIVTRAFGIVDCFIATAEARNALKVTTDETAAQAFRRSGELCRIKQEAEWPREKQKAREMVDAAEKKAEVAA